MSLTKITPDPFVGDLFTDKMIELVGDQREKDIAKLQEEEELAEIRLRDQRRAAQRGGSQTTTATTASTQHLLLSDPNDGPTF